MSHDLRNAVWERGPKNPAMRAVLLSLADRADDDGYCYPSHADTADRTGYSRRTVITTMQRLESEGWLTQRPRYKAGAERSSNGIWLDTARLLGSELVSLGNEAASPRSEAVSPPVVNVLHQGSEAASPESSFNLHLESEEDDAPAPATPLQELADHFRRRTALTPNGNTPNYGRDWRQPLEAILALAGNDPPAACALIDRALAVAWGENEQRKVYTVSAPRSIAGIAANLAAQQRNGASAADADSLWQQALAVVTGTKTSDSRLLTAIRAIGADRIRMARESDAPRLKQELAHGYYRPVTTAA